MAARRVARAAVQINLTAVGWAVVVMGVAAAFMSASSRLAIGFMIPIAAALVLDVYLSWHFVTRRSVTITPSRTVAHTPDGIPLRVSIDGRAQAMRLEVTCRGGIREAVGLTEGFEIVELLARHPLAVDVVRCNLICSVLGLGRANRWESHVLSTLHWAPPPDTTRLTVPSAVDEVARLRLYEPGDRMSRVSWPVTARTGQMHVRAAGDGYEEFTVVVNLDVVEGEPGEGAVVSVATQPDIAVLNASLKLASTLISQLLEDGYQVRVITAEPAPHVRAEFLRDATANPRLAAMVPGDVAVDTVVVDRHVTDEDDVTRRLAMAEIAPAVASPYGAFVEVSMLGVRTRP